MFSIYKPSKIILYKKIRDNSEFVNGTVLDAGSSGSKRYNHLFKNAQKIITLDINPEYKPDIIASVEKIPEKDNTFDSIVCFQVLGDVSDLGLALSEFYRVLKPGGIILASESLFNEIHGAPNDFWRFTNFGLEKMFQKAGFKVTKVEQVGGYFSVMAQMEIRYLIERFNLFENKLWNIVLAPVCKIFGSIGNNLDKIDHSEANKKFAIGYLIVARKS